MDTQYTLEKYNALFHGREVASSRWKNGTIWKAFNFLHILLRHNTSLPSNVVELLNYWLIA